MIRGKSLLATRLRRRQLQPEKSKFFPTKIGLLLVGSRCGKLCVVSGERSRESKLCVEKTWLIEKFVGKLV